MKKFIVFISALFFSVSLFSQVTLSSEDLEKLDPAVKSQIESLTAQKQISDNLENVSKWAGLGREIGLTVKESLEAVVDVSDKFSKTNVGKFTLALVFYKIAGRDVLQLFVGLLWIMIILIVSYRLYHNNCDRRVLVEKKWDSEGKGWNLKYQTIGGDEDFKVGAIVILCVGLVVSLAIIFF